MVGVVQLSSGHEPEVLPDGAKIAVFLVVLTVEHLIHIFFGDAALQVLELDQNGQPFDLSLSQAAALQKALVGPEGLESGMGLVGLRQRLDPGISGIEFGVSHLFRLLLVPEDLVGGSLGQAHSAGDELSFDQIGIAEQA